MTLSEHITFCCHLSLTAGLYHRNDSSNVLANDPRGSDFGYGTKHLREEIAVILRSLAASCDAEGLAGESTGKHVDLASPRSEICFSNVSISYTFIKPIIKYLVAEPVNLAVEEILPSHPYGGKLRSSYSTKQRGMCHMASLQLICLCPLRYLLLVCRRRHFY